MDVVANFPRRLKKLVLKVSENKIREIFNPNTEVIALKIFNGILGDKNLYNQLEIS